MNKIVWIVCVISIISSKYYSLTGPVDGLDIPIDPVKLKKIKILSGNGPVNLNTTLSKAVVKGLSNTVFVTATYVLLINWSVQFLQYNGF